MQPHDLVSLIGGPAAVIDIRGDVPVVLAANAGFAVMAYDGMVLPPAFARACRRGGESEVEWRGRLWRVNAGPPAGDRVLLTACDVSEHRDLGQALRDSRQRLGDLVATVPGMVFQLKMAGAGRMGFTYVSPRSRDLFALEPEDLLRDMDALRIHPDDRARMRTSLAEAARTEAFWATEGRVLAPDETVRWWRGLARPLRQGDGDIVFNGILLDITLDKAREQTLIDLAAEAQRQRQAAQDADAAKSRFMAHMSHELRTPLNAIIGFSEIIGEAVFGPVGHPRYQEYARDIHSSGTHLLALINDLLDLSRLQDGELELDMVRTDVSDLVETTLRPFLMEAEQRGVRLDFRRPAAPVTARVDPRSVRQILLNLVSNALRFCPTGSAVRVRLEETEASLVFEVEDEGRGYPPAVLETISKPFGSAGTPYCRSEGGTGLGLVITRTLCERLGGTLTLANAPGARARAAIARTS